jgi:hypothetical protein
MRDYKESDEVGSLIESCAVDGLQELNGDPPIGCELKNYYLHGICGVVVV